ncbi:transporter [Mucilaginibacter sp. SMC90]|uniref:transporter n=1 Tax=Mucilaginibacter sp. SMC90 TaxID=2929803 RepID=UPI001FB1CA92|nr:transporter [Mucilaginibacter sp. SMC90]UOE49092.1 transporter [Mucilaginibacter sp. SMC90]
MKTLIPLFKEWVPQWLIRITIFIVLLPSLVLFFLPLSNVNAAAGYYGIEPADVQYSVLIYYAGYTSFFSLEKRFFKYLAAKEYFFIFTILQIVTSFACYQTHSLPVLLVLRFIQGMGLTSTANLGMSIIFNRLTSERGRAISYSVYFGMLVCMIPFNNFVTADLIDSFDFNVIYKGAMFSYLPGLALLSIIMNNARLNIKFPLYLLDWASFIWYGCFLCSLGYVLVYGQERYWLGDRGIFFASIFLAVSLLMFVLRQTALKRPYFKLQVFNYRNFILGGAVLFVLYLCRFTLNFSSAFFSGVFGFDPAHVSYINLFNIAGIVIGVIISCSFLLQHRPIRLIWIYGFLSLLAFHCWMYFLFSVAGNPSTYYIPLFLHGLGVGLLISPTIIFMVSAVPQTMVDTSAGICLFVRCFGFYASIALINYFDLLNKEAHLDALKGNATAANPLFKQAIIKQSKSLISHGVAKRQSAGFANRLVNKQFNIHAQIRSAMDYYELVIWMLIFTLVVIALFPYINKTVVRFKKNQPAPF